MQDYLLDSNHVSAVFNKEEKVIERLSKIPYERKLIISDFVLGELKAGPNFVQGNFDQSKCDELLDFVNERFYRLERPNDISDSYGAILGRIAQNHPKKSGQRTETWLASLGVQINDVWITSEAWSHNVVFVTDDNMKIIKEAVNNDIRFQNWRA